MVQFDRFTLLHLVPDDDLLRREGQFAFARQVVPARNAEHVADAQLSRRSRQIELTRFQDDERCDDDQVWLHLAQVAVKGRSRAGGLVEQVQDDGEQAPDDPADHASFRDPDGRQRRPVAGTGKEAWHSAVLGRKEPEVEPRLAEPRCQLPPGIHGERRHRPELHAWA
jgi:hypothetical protein